MVQNTNILSYHSIILPLHFPIRFTLHNIPIGYKIFSITELHLKYVNRMYTECLSTKIKY